MSNANLILQTLLKCGYLDIEFIEKELEIFKVEPDDIIDYHTWHFGSGISDANALIHCLYEVALENAIKELEIEEFDYKNFETFCNCLDSHCYMTDDNGDWHEMSSYEDLIEFLETYHIKPQDDVYRS